MRSAALLSLVLLGCARAYELPRPVLRASRRAVLDDAAASCCVLAASALAAVPQAARADLADLDAGDSAAPVPMETISSGEAVQMITLSDGAKKPKKISTPGARIKELEAKKDKTDKEKKELRKLKSDEVCEGETCPRAAPAALTRGSRACSRPIDVRDARKRLLTSSCRVTLAVAMEYCGTVLRGVRVSVWRRGKASTCIAAVSPWSRSVDRHHRLIL